MKFNRWRPASLLERFEGKYVPEPNSGCWLWEDSVGNHGYGVLKVPGGTRTAHRFSYETHVGPVPDGMHVCHRCDVRECVNPDHLFLGTNDDNHADKLSKGRQARGSMCNKSRLTAEDIPVIRELVANGWTLALVAKRFGVSRSSVGRIKRGVDWRHV